MTKEPGKKKKGKPKKPSDEPRDQKEPETVIITEVTRIIQEGDKMPGFPGEPVDDTKEPTKLPSREGTPGKEPTPTIFGWKETPEKPEVDDKEPGKKKKGKPKKPSDEPRDQKEPETVIITEVTRIIQEGDKMPGFPGEPTIDTKEPTKLPSREGTPGKEPTPTIFGWKETPEKPEADDKEPGKKKKGKPKKPSDEPRDQKEPETVIITEVTRIIQEGDKMTGFPGEPVDDTKEPTKLPSREGTPGKEPTPTIFGWKETPEKPEADDKEPGKKKKGKPKKPSDEPRDQKEPETVIITEVTRIIQEGDKVPEFPGEPVDDTKEPTKLPSREGTPGKEPTPTIFGWKETPEKPEADDKEPGKKKKGKPKKPSDEPRDQKEPETVIITEVTRIIQEGDKMPGFPGEPVDDTKEPTKLPSREGTPGKEPTPTIFGWKETPEKPEADDKEPGKKKKGKPKKPSDEPRDQKEPETVIITEVTRIIQEGDKMTGFPGEPVDDTKEPTKLPSREGTPGKEPTPTIFGWKETPEKPEADDKEPGKKKKGKPKKPSDEPRDQKEPETVIITEVTRIIQEGDKMTGFPGEPVDDTKEPTKLPSREGTPGKEPTPTIFGWKETPEKPEADDKEPGKKRKEGDKMPGFPGEPVDDTKEPTKLPSREGTPGKEPTPTIFGWKETPEKPEADDKEPGKKKKGKPKKPSDEPRDQKEPETVIITEVTRIIQEGDKMPGFPGEPVDDTKEPTKLPSREGTPGKEPTPTIFGWKETPEKPEADDKEPGKKKKGKPKKPSDEPRDQKEPETVIITEVTRIIQEGDKMPGFPGEPVDDTKEPTKLPSREGTPGKEPTPTIFGWKETPEKPEADDKEPGKKKKGKPKKPSDEPRDQKEPETVIITEVTRIIQEGDKMPGFPGEPVDDTKEPTKLPSREGTPGKEPTPTIFGWKETPEKPEADDKEPGKKKKGKPKKPSDEPRDQKEPETVIITEVTRIIQEGDKMPGFPGEPVDDTKEPTKLPSREGTPGKEPTPTIFGWKETPEKPEADDKEPGKKKKGKPKKPSDEPRDQKEPETVIITEVTRIIQEGDKMPGFPGEPVDDTKEPTKLPSREGTPGKEPTPTIFGWKETPEKPEADDKEPGKKKKGKPKKPSDEPRDQKEPETVIITEVTRIIQEGDKMPGFPGEPVDDTKEPTKLPSREGTPGKEPTPTIFGWKETPEKPEDDDKEPGKKKKGKPKKPSDEPRDQKEPETVIITEVTRIIQEGDKMPGFPGEPRGHTWKGTHSTIFGWKETPEKPEADDKEPGKKKKGKPKKPSDEPRDQKEPETVIITEVTRIIQEGDKVPGFPGEPVDDTKEPTKLPSREGTPGKEPTPILGWKETPEKPEADDKEPGKKKKGKPKKPSDEPRDQKEPETVIITEVTRIIQEGDKVPEFPGEPVVDTKEPTKLPSREGTPGKEPTPTIFGWKETPEKPEADDKEPGKKKKGKPKKPSDEPRDQKEPETVIITEVTRIIQEGDKMPGFPGEPVDDTKEPTKLPSREGTPGKEPTPTIFGWKETPEKPEADDKEPGKKKKGKPKKPSDEPRDQKEPETVIITEVTRIIQEGDKMPGFPGEPVDDTKEPTKLPSREGTPGKEPTPTIFGWKETPEKPEADDKEPGKKKKGKPKKPSDEPRDQKEPETVIITEVTRIIQEGDKMPGFPGEPVDDTKEPTKLPSREGTPGKEPTPTIFGWKETPEKPEDDDKEPGKKKKGKPKKPSDEPRDQKEPETVIITEVTRIIQEGDKMPGFPGEPVDDTKEPTKLPSREGTPGKEPTPTIFGWKETPEKPEADDKEPGKKKKGKPKKPSDEPRDQKEPETVIITEVTRIIQEGDKMPGFPGEPVDDTKEPTKLPSREGTPGKEPTPTIFGWKETPEKPEADDKEPGKKKKGKPKKPSDEPRDQKEPETVIITEVTRIIQEGDKMPGFPGEPVDDTKEPTKLPSREGTPGKEPTPTIFGWKETPEKPEDDDKEPGKKKKGRRQDARVPRRACTIDTKEPTKLPSREGTPGKEPTPTIFGWKETPEKPEADDKEPGKKKKGKPKKPSDEPRDQKEPETVIITEVTRIIQEGDKMPGFPGEPVDDTKEPTKLPSREGTPGKEPTPTIFGWKETPEKPEDDDKEPGKKKKGKPKKPSDEPRDQKEPETVIITEVTRIIQEGDKMPGFPGEPVDDTKEPTKLPSREGTPGKEPTPIFGWKETPEKPEDDDKEPGKKKKGKPKKPSDEPRDQKEPETVIITEVTRIIQEGDKMPGFPGEPVDDTKEPTKLPSREGTPGKEPTPTIFGWKKHLRSQKMMTRSLARKRKASQRSLQMSHATRKNQKPSLSLK
ncbi:titin-like [Rhipicephalus sanguineus]|uniref:titin-like n=1 Tax=Rhipicephalus sanguineus TaxID=34632 RepID=UPI0020C41EF5|nr:titin-like [Rhipicephalus sanguineus]